MTRNHQDRFILQSTAEVMNSAVRHIDSIVNWMAGDGSLSYGGMTVPGSVNELRRCKSELAEALQKSAFFLADEWNYIENNRARLAEVDRFLEMYGFFRDRVIAYDDARMDNEEKAWKRWTITCSHRNMWCWLVTLTGSSSSRETIWKLR